MVRACMHTYTYVHKLTDPSTYDAVHCKAAWPDPNLGCKLWRTQAAQKLGWKQHHTAVPNCRGYLLSRGGWGQPLVLSSWGFKRGGSSSRTLVAGPFPTAFSVDAGRVLTLLRCSVRGSPEDPRAALAPSDSAGAGELGSCPVVWLCPLQEPLLYVVTCCTFKSSP